MSFNYKNPLSPLNSLGTTSLQRTEVYGTNFSVLSTGGYMEVYTLNDLYFTIPSGTTGLVEYTGNTIPIQFQKGTGAIFSPDVLTLNSDNISSGRRRIGMLVYVIDEDQIYQYQIPNFENLWTGATSASGPGGPTVVMSDFGTTIKSNSPQGISFISAWTANTIEGISGETSLTAVWKKLVTGGVGGGDFLPLSGGTVTGDTIFTSGLTANTFSAATYLGLPIDVYVTGGTYSAGTATFTNNTGGTVDVLGFYTGAPDVYVTGGTYSAGTATFTNNTGGTFDVLGFYTGATDVYVTGGTYSAGTATFTNNTGGTFDIIGFYTGSTDVYVTGGTYSAGTATFTNNTGGTFNITGFISANTFTTGFTFDISNYDLTIKRNDGIDLSVNLSILASDVTITGGTYDPNTGTATFTNNTGGTFNVTGFITGFTDIYVTGGTFDKNSETLTLNRNDGNDVVITGFTDVYVTGGTYSAGTITLINNSGITFDITGLYTGATDVFVTGGTYSAGTATFTNNTGGTFDVLGFYTGATDVYVTGGTYSGGIATFTNNTGGTFDVLGFYTGATDVFVTGGTYSAGTATFTNNTGGTFDVIGFYTGATDVYVTGGTYSGGTAIFTNNTGGTFNVVGFYTGATDVYVTGGTYSAGTATFTNNTGGTFDVLGFYTGATDVYVTGGTYSSGTATFTNNTGGTFNVVGFFTGATDVFVTGGTFSSGTATFTNNTGGTFTVTGFSSDDTYVTGLTLNGHDLLLTQNRTDIYSSFTVTLSAFSGNELNYYVSATTPTGVVLKSGDRWFNTNTGVELVWINDGDSSQWIQPFSVPGPISPDAGYYTTTGITISQTLTWDKTYWGISGSTNVDLTLPPTTAKEGYYLIIKDESGSCGIYRIRITPSSGTIENTTFVDMNINYMSLTCIVRNGNWYLI
jgi:hypothetical protein